MSTHRFVTDGLEQCPFMPAFGAPTVMFERGSGTELWDTDGRRNLFANPGAAAAAVKLNAVTATALRWTPPLTVSDDEIEEAVTILSGVLAP